jgi:uncharacterized protein YyaL (SSP411 family)
MTGREDFAERARATLARMSAQAARAPLALTYLWVAADFLEGRRQEVVIAGRPGAEDTQALLAAVRHPFLPRKVVLLADGGEGQRWLAEGLEFLRGVKPERGRATAFVCEDYVCQLPTTDAATVTRQLKERRVAVGR